MSTLEQVAKICFLAGLLVGLATHWSQLLWPLLVAQFLLAAGLVSACVHRYRANCSPPLSCWLILPLLPALLGTLQYFLGWSLDPWQTRRVALEWVGCGVASFLGYLLLAESHKREKFLRGFALFALSLSLYATLQNYAAPGRIWWVIESGFRDQVFGPFTYHTKFAIFVELALATTLWFASRPGCFRPLWLAAAAVLVSALAASQSRGGVLLAGFEVILLLWLILSRERSMLARFGLSVSFLAVLLLCGWILGSDALLERFASQGWARDGRQVILSTSLEMTQEAPWMGGGLGAWPAMYPAYARFDANLRINQAHCDWLQWRIEGGWPMLFVMVLMAMITARCAIREFWCFGLMSVFMHAAIDYPFQQTPGLSLLFFAFWGISLHTLRKSY